MRFTETASDSSSLKRSRSEPGTVFEYSFSTDVLGAVVEKVSGQRLGAFLDARVWKPLGMTDATFAVPAAKRSRLAYPLAKNPLDGKP